MSAVSVTILSGGKAVDGTYQVASVDVCKEVNRIPRAELVLLDGDAPTGKFAVSDAGAFDPGKAIEIQIRREKEDPETVFKGVVVKQGIAASARGSRLRVEMRDAAVKLAHSRRSAVYREKKDSDVIEALVNAAKLKPGKVSDAGFVHPELVQYRVTDWDFILSRAEATGMIVVAEDGELAVSKVAASGGADHEFAYGMSSILDFDFELDATSQEVGVQSVGWDAKALAPTKATAGAALELPHGDLKTDGVGKSLGFPKTVLRHHVPLDPKELKAWADARMARARLGLIRGVMTVRGDSSIKQLQVVKLRGIGKHFSGDAVVTGVRHRYDETGWRTDVQFGLSVSSLAGRHDVREPAASGLLPGVSGLQVGIVDAFAEDPNKHLRVKVRLPLEANTSEDAVWARLLTPDAGPGRGMVFRPEAGDEVVVGFINDDPRRPVVLGGLHGVTNVPPEPLAKPTAKNETRAIVSRAGSKLEFSDVDEPGVSLQTPGANKLILSDGAGGSVVLSDQHGNSLTLGKNGIEIKSTKSLKIVLDTGGDVVIKGSKVDIQ